MSAFGGLIPHWISWRLALRFAVACLVFSLAPTRSFAVDPAIIDFTVDAFVAGGEAVGVTISPDEVAIVKPLVQCIADGKRVADCAKKTIIAQLPPESQAFANCVTNGRTAQECAKQTAIGTLPPQAQQLARCVVEQNDVAECGKKFATTQVEQAAFSTLDKLKTDASNQLGQVTGPIQNILNVVDGVAHNDWEKVAANGGKAVTKYVVRIVLTTLLTQAGSVVAGPVIDTIVENRIDLALDLIKALKAKDAPRISQVLLEAYLLSGVEVDCALIPNGAVKEAICGTIGKIIGALGGAAGDVTEALVDAVKDPLAVPGEVTDLIGRTVAGKDNNCGTPEQTYTQSFAICYNRGAYLDITDPIAFNAFEGSLYQTQCRQHFIKCFTPDGVSKICNPLYNLFDKHAKELAQALTQAAAVYGQNFRTANPQMMCDRDSYQAGVDKFVSDCENSLQKQIPLFGDATWENCRPGAQPQLSAVATASQAACRKEVSQHFLEPANVVNDLTFAAMSYAKSFPWYVALYKDQICSNPFADSVLNNFIDLCADSLKSSSAQCGAASQGKDACRQALQQIDPGPTQVIRDTCGTSPAIIDPNAPLPSSILKRPPISPFVTPPPSPPLPTCFANMVRNAEGRCVCPPGRVLMGGRCVRVPVTEVVCGDGTRVPVGTACPVSRPSEVRCPDGSQAPSFIFCRKRCPDGTEVRVSEACPPPPPPKPTGVRCPDGSEAPSFALCRKRCPDGAEVRVNEACPPPPPPKPTGVRCPDGSDAATFALCRKRCPDGREVRVSEACPSLPSPKPAAPCPATMIGTPPNCHCPEYERFERGRCVAASRTCPAGYRVLQVPNKYGAYCEPIPVPGPEKPAPSETRRPCPPGTTGRWPLCRRPQTPQPTQTRRQCPAGSRGHWPLCHRPQQQKCPRGLTGPNCDQVVVH